MAQTWTHFSDHIFDNGKALESRGILLRKNLLSHIVVVAEKVNHFPFSKLREVRVLARAWTLHASSQS